MATQVATTQRRGLFYTTVAGLDGGLHVSDPPQAVPPGAWVVADNFRFRRGRAELIPGWDNIAVTGLSGNPFIIDEFYGAYGTRLMLVTSAGSYFMNGDVLSGVWTTINGMTASEPAVWSAQYNQVWYCGGSGKTAYKWTTGNATTVTAIPHATFGVIWANRLFVGNINEDGGETRVYHSAQGLPESWDTSINILDEFEEVGGPITGLVPISPSELAVHKANGLWRVLRTGSGDQPFVVEFVPDTPGAQWYRYACRGRQGAQLFVAHDNVYLWDGSSRPVAVGDPIFADLLAAQRTELFAALNLWTWYDPLEGVFLIVYRGTAASTADDYYQGLLAYEFDPMANTWCRRTFEARAATVWNDQWATLEAGYRAVIAGRTASASHVSVLGRTYGLNTTTNIPGVLKSGAFPIGGNVSETKRVMAVRLFTASGAPTAGSVTVQVNHGDDPGNLTAGTAQTVSLASGSDRVVFPQVTGRWFQLQINATCRGGALAFTGFELEWKPGGRT